MNINIKTSGITLTDAISEYVSKRLDSIQKLIKDEAAQCDVELGKTTSHHRNGDIFRAEIHIVGKDTNIYVTSEKEDLYAAIDAVRDEAARELTSSKDRKQSLIRRGGAKLKNSIKGLWN